MQRTGRLSIDLTDHLRHERALAEKNGHQVATEPIKIEVTMVFAISNDKGIMDVCMKAKRKVVGVATIEWETTSNWLNQPEVKGEHENIDVNSGDEEA